MNTAGHGVKAVSDAVMDSKPGPAGMTWRRALVLTLPQALLLSVVLLKNLPVPTPTEYWIAFPIALLFFCGLFFMMLWTGRTDPFRAAGFVAYALMLSLSFATHMIAARGSISLSLARVLECEVPFCHIVTPMLVVPAALTGSLIFPGRISGAYASIAGMLVLVAVAALAIGRGFCGWACFFGGWDDGFSRVLPRPLIRRSPAALVYLPFAVLLLVAIGSAAALSPVYCQWICPFKAVTEFEAVTSARVLVQTVIFVSLFLVLVVALPMLTRRRTQCGLFCPMGAFLSFANSVSPFTVRIDPGRCVKCGRCVRACPVFALDERSLETGRPRLTCLKCGRCVDVCPRGAVRFRIRLVPASFGAGSQRVLFLYAAFVFLAVMGGVNVQQGLSRLVKWVMTGSLV